MAESTKSPLSLDQLLSANREQFDSMFTRQMAAAPPPVAPVRVARNQAANQAAASADPPLAEAASVADPQSSLIPAHEAPSVAGSIISELNRRFTITWSSEILASDIDNGRAVVRCKLNVGDQSQIETGASAVAREGDEAAALQRAQERALKKCADHFASNGAVTVKSPPTTSGPPSTLAALPQKTLTAPALVQRAALQTRAVDVVMLDQVQSALTIACNLMRAAMGYRALSQDLLDMPAAPAMITNARGEMIAGRFGSYVAHMLSEQSIRFEPGDVLLQSDPYHSHGAVGHLREWMILAPIFYTSDAGPELVGFTSLAGQVSDVGGDPNASGAGRAATVFGEGLRIAPIKILAGGKLDESALQLILNNSRTPHQNRADLMALVAGCQAGQAQVLALCERFGLELYQRIGTGLLERSKRIARALIVEQIPEEPQSFEDQIDDDGCGNGPFKLKLTVWREGEHAYFDWTGSAAQAPGPINFYLHVGLAKAWIGQYLTRQSGVRGGAILGNDGFYELIHVTLPKGSLLNPEFPAATGEREHALARHAEMLRCAVNRHKPSALNAAGYGAGAMFRFAGTDARGRGFEYAEMLGGGLAAGPSGDGRDGITVHAPASAMATEQVEHNFPIVIESCASIEDTGGAGLTRGGNGLEKTYRMLVAGHVSIQDDRHKSVPWGVCGGHAGQCSGKWRVAVDGSREPLPAKVSGLRVAAGERIVFRTAGGGGCGDPLQRDPVKVQGDVLRSLLTVDAAIAHYGVVLGGPALAVDVRATQELRERRRRERKTLDLFNYGDPA